MIKYILKCKNKHEFESWFSDSSEFEKLKKKDLLECIFCGSQNIEKSIMSPKVLNSSSVLSYENQTQQEIRKLIIGKSDVVMSDMAVNTTGIKNIDSIQTGELCKDAMFFSKDVISNNGFFISKIFMGGSFNEIIQLGKKIFKEVKVFKPKSSRKDSKESFIICKNLR